MTSRVGGGSGVEALNILNELRRRTSGSQLVDEVPESIPEDIDEEPKLGQVGHTVTTYLLGSKNQLLNLFENNNVSASDDEEEPDYVHDLVTLLTSITAAIKTVSAQVRRMGLPRAKTRSTKALNHLANETWIKSLLASRQCCVMVSEDLDEPIIVEGEMKGRYAVVFDPLTGTAEPSCEDMVKACDSGVHDVMQPGRQLVAAGYALYGSCTVLMFSIGDGVHGFTLDPTMNEFILSHENVRIPFSGHYYSINEGRKKNFEEPIQEMLRELKAQPALDGRKRKLRYAGSMVADIHRTIMYGGVYMYPAHKDRPSVHDRLPVFMGSEDDVNYVCGFFRRHRLSSDEPDPTSRTEEFRSDENEKHAIHLRSEEGQKEKKGVDADEKIDAEEDIDSLKMQLPQF